MTEQSSAKPRNTREFRNINLFKDLIPGYRMPMASVVSILHRVSGFIMALLLPLIVWVFDKTLTSELSYAAFTGVFSAWYVKLVLLGIVWAFLHHLCAGVRHLMMDLHIGMSKQASKASALAVFGVSIVLTVLLALKMFGVF